MNICDQTTLKVLQSRRDQLQEKMMAARKEHETCKSAYVEAQKEVVKYMTETKSPDQE